MITQRTCWKHFRLRSHVLIIWFFWRSLDVGAQEEHLNAASVCVWEQCRGSGGWSGSAPFPVTQHRHRCDWTAGEREGERVREEESQRAAREGRNGPGSGGWSPQTQVLFSLSLIFEFVLLFSPLREYFFGVKVVLCTNTPPFFWTALVSQGEEKKVGWINDLLIALPLDVPLQKRTGELRFWRFKKNCALKSIDWNWLRASVDSRQLRRKWEPRACIGPDHFGRLFVLKQKLHHINHSSTDGNRISEGDLICVFRRKSETRGCNFFFLHRRAVDHENISPPNSARASRTLLPLNAHSHPLRSDHQTPANCNCPSFNYTNLKVTAFWILTLVSAHRCHHVEGFQYTLKLLLLSCIEKHSFLLIWEVSFLSLQSIYAQPARWGKC